MHTERTDGELENMHAGIQVKAEIRVQPVHCAHQLLIIVHDLHTHTQSNRLVCRSPMDSPQPRKPVCSDKVESPFWDCMRSSSVSRASTKVMATPP